MKRKINKGIWFPCFLILVLISAAIVCTSGHNEFCESKLDEINFLKKDMAITSRINELSGEVTSASDISDYNDSISLIYSQIDESRSKFGGVIISIILLIFVCVKIIVKNFWIKL